MIELCIKFLDRLLFKLIYERIYKKKFGYYGKNISWGRNYERRIIPNNIRISYHGNIFINDGCKIDEFCHLMAGKNGKLTLGKNVRFANGFIHIGAFEEIEILDNVLIASMCQIINGNHGFKDKTIPIMHQKSTGTGKIKICEGVWIGRGASIMGGVTIGKNSVVGTNSVVTKTIADYQVVAGIPAKIIRKID